MALCKYTAQMVVAGTAGQVSLRCPRVGGFGGIFGRGRSGEVVVEGTRKGKSPEMGMGPQVGLAGVRTAKQVGLLLVP